MAKIIGSNKADKINGKAGSDRLEGKNGDDTLIDRVGNNVLYGDNGHDILDVSFSSGNNILEGGVGNDTLKINYSSGNNKVSGSTGNDSFYAYKVKGSNILNGENGNDSFYLLASRTAPSSLITQTVDGGKDYDYLFVDYSKSTERIITTFDATTNQGLITSGNNQVIYKNIEKLKIVGTAFNDQIVGSNGKNKIFGGAGNDYLSVDYSTSNNILKGGTGDDNLSASFTTGDNLLDGGDGNDNLFVSSYYDYSDSNAGALGNNTLNGGKGNDSIYFILYTSPASLKIQTVDGGAGEDVLKFYYDLPTEGITSTYDATTNRGSITAGKNLINYKNIEQLEISGTAHDDHIVGSNGNDSFDGGINGKDTIDGGAGEDSLSFYGYRATAGITSIFDATTNKGTIKAGTYQVSYKNIERLAIAGTRYDDQIIGSSGNDSLDSGGDGKDTIDGGAGDDLLFFINYQRSEAVTSTFDVITNQGTIKSGSHEVSYKDIERLDILGTAYDDKIVGSKGNDSLNGGGNGNDKISGGAGDDKLIADYSNGNNWLDGGDGNDYLSASGDFFEYRGEVSINYISGNNTLKGGAGDDKLIANYTSGNNLLEGGDGNDYLSASGAVGNNILNGGLGDDILIAGKGIDTFVFNSYNQGVDHIDNFNAISDRIQISSAGFDGGLSTGKLLASQFIVGTSATTSNQQFIYNLNTGGLYFDQDGSGSTFSQVKFAQLSTGLSLTNNNFVVA